MTRLEQDLITLKFKERDNFRTMMRIEKRIIDGVEQAAEETANAIVTDIRKSWSTTRQTIGSGTPPGVDTGNLDSSVMVDPQGRDEAGHFAGKDAKVRFIRVDTTEGTDNNGRGNYAMALEDPDYYDLPFLAPALERGFGLFTSNIKRFVR